MTEDVKSDKGILNVEHFWPWKGKDIVFAVVLSFLTPDINPSFPQYFYLKFRQSYLLAVGQFHPLIIFSFFMLSEADYITLAHHYLFQER